MRSRVFARCLVVVALGAAACVPAPATNANDDNQPAGRSTFAFEPVDTSGVTPRWGAPAVAGMVVGGVDDSMAVTDQVLAVGMVDGALMATAVGALDVPRFCGCALYDEARRELLVIGGRDDFYRDETSVVLIDVDTGERAELEHGGAANSPVGCHAFFSPAHDRGYLFGGASSASGFSKDTWRYHPEERSFTRLDIAGPQARYDGGIVTLVGGDALLVGGMGAGASVKFYADAWRFEVATESWSELLVTQEDGPPGRRVPWLALSPDERTLLYGFGSDSPQGQSVLADLWRLDLSSGSWATAEVEGELPAARGFTQRLPGPSGVAGLLAFGSDAAMNIHDDAYLLLVPDELSGDWR